MNYEQRENFSDIIDSHRHMRCHRTCSVRRLAKGRVLVGGWNFNSDGDMVTPYYQDGDMEWCENLNTTNKGCLQYCLTKGRFDRRGEEGKKMKNPCCSCEYRGDLFKLGDGGIPHCHCHYPSIPPEKFGWDTLQEAFWTCDKFKRRQKAVEK